MTIHGFFPVVSGYLPDLPICNPDEAAVTNDGSAVVDWSHDTQLRRVARLHSTRSFVAELR
jgi:hypothetical protein